MDALIVRSARTAEGPMMLMISGHVDCDLPKADRDRLFDYDAGVLYGILRNHIPSGTYYALVKRIMEDRRSMWIAICRKRTATGLEENER